MQSEVSGSSTHRPALVVAGCYPGFLPCWRRQKLPALSPLLSTGANPFPKAWLSASHLHPHPPSLTPWCGTEWGLGSSPVCCSSSSIIGLFLSLQPHPAPALFLSRIIHPLDIHEGSASTRFARHSQIHHTLPNLVLPMSFLHLERHFLPHYASVTTEITHHSKPKSKHTFLLGPPLVNPTKKDFLPSKHLWYLLCIKAMESIIYALWYMYPHTPPHTDRYLHTYIHTPYAPRLQTTEE